jgi:hypothetical protein
MGFVHQPWFMPILLLFLMILERRLIKKEEDAYREDAKKYISIEGRVEEDKIIPPWRRMEEKKEEKKKKSNIGFWIINVFVILYIIFVWFLTKQGFSIKIYEIIAGFAFAFYFFNMDIPGLLSNIWTYREYPGGIKGEVILSKHFVLASKKIEAKIYLFILVIFFFATLSYFIGGSILALIIRMWLIDRRLSRTPLPDW